jgi:hypothetical protein
MTPPQVVIWSSELATSAYAKNTLSLLEGMSVGIDYTKDMFMLSTLVEYLISTTLTVLLLCDPRTTHRGAVFTNSHI